jgi:hypothetical protein
MKRLWVGKTPLVRKLLQSSQAYLLLVLMLLPSAPESRRRHKHNTFGTPNELRWRGHELVGVSGAGCLSCGTGPDEPRTSRRLITGHL